MDYLSNDLNLVGIAVFNPSGNLIYSNNKAKSIMKIEEDGVINIDNINEIIKDKNNTQGKVNVLGKMFEYEKLIDDNNGKIVLVIIDNWCKEELDKSKELLNYTNTILDSFYDGIFITDSEANVLRINKSYERITGVSWSEFCGKNMREVVEKGIISCSSSLKVLEQKKTVTMQQEFITGKKAFVTAKPVFDDNGEISMVVTNVRDITELERLKDELEENKNLAQIYFTELEELKKQLIKNEDIVARDKKMIEVVYMLKKIASVNTTILLLGETGVGKEVAAKYIHKHSKRKEKQFIKINCGAIPENLIESELFGYEKGSFTGAKKEGSLGIFEEASGGTLFLDEIGELPLNMQVKLLRVLQEGEVTRIGGVIPRKVDVRIIAATNRNLEEMIKAKKFREDLYYRLNVLPINIPPLRERRGDIIPLIKYFISFFNSKYEFEKHLSNEAIEVLYNYNWYGNIRELKNIIERVVVLSSDNIITKENLPKSILSQFEENKENILDTIMPLKEAVAIVEKNLIEKSYKKHGNVRAAAKELGIDPATFVRKRKKYIENNN